MKRRPYSFASSRSEKEDEEDVFEEPERKRPLVLSDSENESEDKDGEEGNEGLMPTTTTTTRLGDDDQAEERKRAKEEQTYKEKKRLPELDFVLTFAHRRVRALLQSPDHEDDVNLFRVLATWLREVQVRFEIFEKQALRFDELESAVLQSQRKHSQIRRDIFHVLREIQEIEKVLEGKHARIEKRSRGLREAQKAQALLQVLRHGGN